MKKRRFWNSLFGIIASIVIVREWEDFNICNE